MRRIIPLQDNWIFEQQGEVRPVVLPHTWNAEDGQDGGNDYYRGTCVYTRSLPVLSLSEGERIYLEFRGANASARVYVNGIFCGAHDGGYSTFRADVTQALEQRNELRVEVDNGINDTVYPQRADFTFYGGLYREVLLIVAPACRFDLGHLGDSGVELSVSMEGDDALIHTVARVCGQPDRICYAVSERSTGRIVATGEGLDANLTIVQAHQWNGVKDPFLYTLTAQLMKNGEVQDQVSLPFGCRTVAFDPQRGFLLNNIPYPLHGVSRHQDRQGVGSVLTPAMMAEDMAIIREMGANAVRLAHYQHDQHVYDLCDELGLVAWAEIPYISEHMPRASANAYAQMQELIAQNRHHPAIVCWALSNEITASGYSQDLYDAHVQLNDLCHAMDPTRPTAMACAFMLPMDSPLLNVPDVLGYNLYFGWYLGTLDQNDEFFDKFHALHPDKPVALTEYGADAVLSWQTGKPERGDYTEQYQAVYHEHLLKMLEKRPYLWGGFVWNMFDFAADARNEGGCAGVNNKGLVTFDRQIRKDAFYLYKAAWNQEPFVHLCGRRYKERAEAETEIKVYSNQREIVLYVDGKMAGRRFGQRVFTFRVALTGEHFIEAVAGPYRDTMILCRVAEPNRSYLLPGREIVNWLDREVLPQPDGYYSVYDTVGALCRTPAGLAFMQEMMSTSNGTTIHVPFDAAMQDMMKNETLLSIITRRSGQKAREQLAQINQLLNKIPK
jgi:beta-galactosidase